MLREAEAESSQTVEETSFILLQGRVRGAPRRHRSMDFSGSPVVDSTLLMQRSRVLSLVRELKILHAAWHGKKKERKKERHKSKNGPCRILENLMETSGLNVHRE